MIGSALSVFEIPGAGIIPEHTNSNLKSIFSCILQTISKKNENRVFVFFGPDAA